MNCLGNVHKMALSSDPHEQKLYHMFQSYSSGDSNTVGLDREALLKLCFSLELKERGQLLVKCLFSGSKTHVSFGEFRQGLLHILEGGLKDSLTSSDTGNGSSFSSDSSDRTSTYSRYTEGKSQSKWFRQTETELAYSFILSVPLGWRQAVAPQWNS